ncbi:MAG TPA: aldo/keto reductase [Tepidisphaeraceae bacterium]|nr:aldo/keto reductase [Tepidisphaeraceae bacterium]
MRYKLLGRSGLRVSEICLGTMTFGEDWGWGAGADESRRMYDAFRDQGGNFIDTANLYTNGTSEKFLGDFMQGHRQSVVLATKYTNSMPGKDPNAAGNHRKSMVQACEASLKRLKTDYIDLYWLHIWDQVTPADEVMRAFDDLVRAGKVLYVGISDAAAWWVSRAQTIAEFRGYAPCVALQIEWNLIERTVERELIPMARALGMAVTPWSPLASGVLTGKYTNRDGSPKTSDDNGRMEQPGMDGFGKMTPQKHAIAKAVMDVAAETGKSAAQVSLNWLRQQATPQMPVIPIIGARKFNQFRDNMSCLKWQLADEHVRRLNDASAIEPGFPADFLDRQTVRTFSHGGTREQLDATFGVA